jgi:pectate lyase-like protein
MSDTRALSVLTRAWLLAAMVVASVTLQLPSGHAQGSAYYVSTSGSDSNAGTLDKPWRTVQKGFKSLQAGDTLYVRGGTFVERIMSPRINLGTSTAHIRVKAYPGERPVIKGLLWMTGPSYWDFDGINVTWDGATGKIDEHMVKLVNGVGWSFRHGELWGAHSYADLLIASTTPGEPANWIVARNCIHDNYGAQDHVNGDQLIYVNTHDTRGGIIRRNVLFGAPNGMGVKLGSSQAAEEGPNAVTVAYNTIYDTNQSILVAWGAQNNDIYRNIMDKVDLEISPVYANVRGYQLTGANNTVHDNMGFNAHSLILNDAGYPGVTDSGGNVFPDNPRWDLAASCSGFHPTDATAAGYGRYAPRA